MNPEDRQLLEEALKLSRENNEMLKILRAKARRDTIYRVIMVLLVVLPLVASIFVLPQFLNQIIQNYSNIQSL